MLLKSLNVKSKIRCLNCAISLYFENTACHSASVTGGMVPRMGCHSVMESPELVKRVMPPRMICTIMSATPTSNQMATGRDELFTLAMARKGNARYGSPSQLPEHGLFKKLKV